MEITEGRRYHCWRCHTEFTINRVASKRYYSCRDVNCPTCRTDEHQFISEVHGHEELERAS